jgi:serine/threonine protein kinase
MSHLSTCADADRLRQLIDGTLPETEQQALIAHLDKCPMCQEGLQEAAASRSTAGLSTTDLSCLAFVREAPLERVLEVFKGDSRPTLVQSPASPTVWIQSFLRPVPSLDLLGRLDTYDVTDLLGQGGMGIVLKAFDPALKRWVAIKVLSPQLANDPISRQRFAREAQAAAAVRHENVVTIHAVSEANGLPFIVMEYVGGGSLQGYLQRHGPLDGVATARVGVQIASGLAAAHAQGLIHRDIKPANILLVGTDDGADTNGPPAGVPRIKITDFGLAHLAHEARLTHTGIVTGTPMYMAPEQALAEKLDARADLFSLGSVLYTLCTGREPFPGSSPIAVLRNVCDSAPVPIRELNPAVPACLAQIIERLHAKRPEDRLDSAAQVAELLQGCADHPERTTSLMIPRVELRKTLARARRRWLAASVLLVGVLALTLGWLLYSHWWRSAGLEDQRIALQAVLEGHTGPIWSAAFAPDGKSAATASDDGTIRIWDIVQGRSNGVLSGHRGAVFSVEFAHKAGFLASGGGDGNLKVWSLTSQKEQASFHHRGGSIRRLAISPDDALIAVADMDRTVELWQVADGQKRATLEGHTSTVHNVIFSRDGRTLASGDLGGIVKFWDPASGVEQKSFRADSLGIRALALSPDGRILASAGTGARDVSLWEVRTQKPLGTLATPEHVQAIAFAPDGRHLATAGRNGIIRLWDAQKASAETAFSAHRGGILSLVFSPDGRYLLSSSEDRLAKIWDVSALGWSK